MNRPELYNKTVDVLKDAYFYDDLKHGSCCACPVAHICRESAMFHGVGVSLWKGLFFTANGYQIINYFDAYGMWEKGQKERVIKMLTTTGYSVEELAKIEHAFETAPKGNSDDEWMFNGLMAVIDVLDIIHENTDTIITISNKEKFLV